MSTNMTCMGGHGRGESISISDHYAIYVVTSMVCVMILAANGTVVFSFFRFRSLHTRANRFLLSLTIADLLTAPAVATLMSVNVYSHWTRMQNNYYPCVFAIFLNNYSTLVSVFSLLGVGFERYVKVFYPLRYECMLSPCLSVGFILFAWVAAIPFAALIFWQNQWYPEIDARHFGCTISIIPEWQLYYVNTPLVGVSILVCTFLHLDIFHIAWVQGKFECANHGSASIAEEHEKNMNLLKMASMILGVMYVTWVPLMVINVAVNRCDLSLTTLFLRHVLDVLNYANSAVNPFIYQWHLPEFRRAFKKVLRLKTSAKRPPNPLYAISVES